MEEEFLVADRQQEEGMPIGYDILGWDMTGFHSYLCNGLDQVINAKYEIWYNNYGLLDHSYEEVKQFANFIEGQGEQVEWLPVKLTRYDLA